MGTYSIIEHKGKHIVLNDLSTSKDTEEAIDTLNNTEAYIQAQPLSSVLLVTDISDMNYDLHGVEAMKNFSAAITPRIKASCVVGVTGIKGVIYRSVVRITGRNIMTIDTRENALDWLAAQ